MRKQLSLVLLSLILSACGSQQIKPEQDRAQIEDRKPANVTSNSGAVSQANVATGDEFDLAKLKDPNSILSKRNVFFDFDSFVINDEFKPLLEAHGRFLAANGKIKMLIQGNADERGSREYNLALGQKRADAVRKTLQMLGAKDEQLEAVSLGEEKPRTSEHDEAAWADNRRADMLYSGEF